MKYIIDSRYKKLHKICVQTNAILAICKRGRSLDFPIALRALEEELFDLEPLKSPPFTREQIAQVDSIEEDAKELLLLPENLEELGEKLLEKAELLLIEIDPFTFSLDDSLGVRKAQIVEYTKELQIYLQAHILHLEGKATSIIDEKLIVEDITSDIKRIEKKQMKTPERQIVDQILKSNEAYQNKPNQENARNYLQVAIDAEFFFRGNKTPYKSLSELVKYLMKVYQEADKKMTSEKEAFPKFTAPLRHPSVANAVSKLKDIKLNSKPLMTARENLLFAYENAALEDGGSFISRCRAIDFYKLFGNELDEFDDLLSERPDRDMKIT